MKTILLKIIFVGLITGLIPGAITYAILDSFMLPDVWFSYSTGECVKVLNYSDSDMYSCENMPRRFYHVWVE